MSSYIVSVFTSFFTVTTLYTISTQREIWIAIFLVAELFLTGIESAITKFCYTREEQKDVDRETVVRFTEILHLTIRFVVVKLFMDIATYRMAITVLQWYDYVNILVTIVAFVLVIFARIEFDP